MPKSSESINKDLEDLLVAKGYEVTALDSSGREVPIPDEADLFTWNFHRGGKDYGTVTATIDGLQKLTLYYDDEVAKSGNSNGDEDGTSWFSLLKQLKKFAQRHQLGFVLKDTDRLRQDMKRRQHVKKLEEGRVKELTADLKDMTAEEFEKAYKMTKAEARAELKPKKKVTEETIHVGYRNSKGDWIKTSTHSNYPDADKAMKDLEAQGKKGVQHRYDNKGSIDPGSRNIHKIDEQGVAANSQTKLDEGYYGNRKMSYSDDTPTVKMVIKHNKQLEERDQRFRHIEKIFLETSAGERFSVPTNKPSRARMFARHIAEGGEYKDDRWAHITEISEDLDKLGGFVRATNNKQQQFNESAQRMISEAVEQYSELRETVKRLSTSRGYNKYFESYEPRVITEDDSDLSEAFRHSTLDTRIESALPTLSKFGIKMDRLQESDMFAEWADSLVDEALDPDTPRQVEALIELLADMIPVGPNAEVAIGELKDVIEDDELYARLRRTAVADPDSDARPQIIAWMQEQDDRKYREALDQIEADDSDGEEDQEKVKQDNRSDSSEPEKVKPKKKKPATPPAGDIGGLPPLPAGDMGGLPPLPPLKEDDVLESLKRLLGR